jgi:hypothetical protein
LEDDFHTLDDIELNKEATRLACSTEEIKINTYAELENFISDYVEKAHEHNNNLIGDYLDIPENIKYLSQIHHADIVWEKIVKMELIEEKNYNHEYVYDFTVPGTESFALFSGIVVHNTLNSVDWKEKILYMKDNVAYIEPIGKMIDDLLLEDQENIEKIEENRTEYLKLNDGYFIPSCDEYGKTGWYKIEAITKHLPVGDLVEVNTESGRNVIATQSKSFLVWNEKEKKFIATQGCDVKIGDILPTTQSLPRNTEIFQDYVLYKNKKVTLNREICYVFGLYLTNNIEILLLEEDIKHKFETTLKDNIISTEFYTDMSNNLTKISEFIYNLRCDYIKAFLSGFFRNCQYDNGNIYVTHKRKNIITGINFLLNYFSITGDFIDKELYILKIHDTKKLEYEILDEYWKELQENNNIKNIETKDMVIFDKVININYVKGSTEYVYDLTVEKTRNFQLFNGLNMRDTFHKAKKCLAKLFSNYS